MTTYEKSRLRGFILAVLEYLKFPMADSALDPIRKSNSLWALRAAATDTIDMCCGMDSPQVESLDTLLQNSDLPTLSEMRERNLQRFRNIVSQNRIKSDADRHFIENYIAGIDADLVSSEEFESVHRMLAAYRPD